MKNVSVKTKLIVGFLVPILLSIFNVGLGIWSTDYVASTMRAMSEKSDELVKETVIELGAKEDQVNTLMDTLDQADQANFKSLDNIVRTSNMISVACIVASVLVTLLVAFSLIKLIAKSVRVLSEAAEEIAKGHVDIDLVKENNDEFGQLVDEYRKVIENIKYQAHIAEEVSNGNLTMTVNPSSPEDLLGNSLRKLVEDNHRALSGINESAYQVTTSSSQVASASQSLAQGSTEQASAIQEITSSIDEIADKTKKNAEEANKASELVLQAISDVKAGNQQMKEMITAMEDINKSSESISTIIKTIDNIAFQTNILALNAAVEAARAGEAGKGFAVVAEEVRSLAAKSAAASAETAELIEDSISKVGAGTKIADDTAKALEAITNVVSQSEVIINGIAESSNYQATAVAQIDQAIAQVSQVVQTNSATSEQCAAASEELSNQAYRMRELLATYNLGHGSAMGMGRGGASFNAPAPAANNNEQIISLGDGFGKY